MTGEHVAPCEYAQQRHQNLVMWRNLWTILLFVFGSAIILFLVGAILLFIKSSWLPAALATVGTVVSGTGTTWVVTRRTEAVEEESFAYKDVGDKCHGDTARADERRAHMVLGGTKRPSGSRPVPPSTSREE